MKALIQIRIIFIISTLIISCKSPSVTSNQESESKSSIENFDEFYIKFHSDSVFQMSRIVFPLEGISVDGFEQQEWTRENWEILKTSVYDIDTAEYKWSVNKTAKEFVEKIWIEDSGFSLEYRYKIIKGKWFLVYAEDQNL
jgi:hypothetical protein